MSLYLKSGKCKVLMVRSVRNLYFTWAGKISTPIECDKLHVYISTPRATIIKTIQSNILKKRFKNMVVVKYKRELQKHRNANRK